MPGRRSPDARAHTRRCGLGRGEPFGRMDALHFTAQRRVRPISGTSSRTSACSGRCRSPVTCGGDTPPCRPRGARVRRRRARVTLSDGRRLDCGLVVGADGGQSRTRELCGIGRGGWAYGQTAVVAHLRTERPHRHTAWQRFLPDGPLAFLPLCDGRVSLVWTTSADAAKELLLLRPRTFTPRHRGQRPGARHGRARQRARRLPAGAVACTRVCAAAPRARRRCRAYDPSARGQGVNLGSSTARRWSSARRRGKLAANRSACGPCGVYGAGAAARMR